MSADRISPSVAGSDRRVWRGTSLLLIAAAIWSINGVLIKGLFAADVGGTSIAAWRSLIAAVALAPFAWRRWHPINEPFWTAGAVLFFTAMCATFVLSTTLTTSANAIILQYTAPAWVFLLSPWLVGERAEARQWYAFGLSMVAVGLIFGSQYRTDLWGMSIGLGSGLAFGTQLVFFRRVRRLDPVVLAFLCCGGSGVILLPIALACDGLPLTPSSGLLLVFTGVVQFGLPYVIYASGMRDATAQKAVLVVMLEPVLNPIWVYLWYREVPHQGTIVGGLLILGSVLYLSWPTRQKLGPVVNPPSDHAGSHR